MFSRRTRINVEILLLTAAEVRTYMRISSTCILTYLDSGSDDWQLPRD